MQYRNLGRSGLRVSALCLGTMQFGWTATEEDSLHVLTGAWEAGINFIDTADIYSRWVPGNPGGVAETILGKWLRASPERRRQVVLATKVRGPTGDGPNDEGLSQYHIQEAVEGSLRRLGVETIDLYQLHWPDEGTPIDETLRALDDLVRRGLVRQIGASNFPAWQVLHGLWTSDRLGLAAFASVQPHYNLVHRSEFERELEAACVEFGLGVLPYSPLAGGVLTGKYQREQPPPAGSRAERSGRMQELIREPRSWAVLDEVARIAARHTASLSQVALAWLLARPTVTSPIIGPRSVEQLHDNLGALDVQLSAEELSALSQCSDWS
jgi:aryl-alcohol dehydrogenase-like predicted oxidoreductase